MMLLGWDMDLTELVACDKGDELTVSAREEIDGEEEQGS